MSRISTPQVGTGLSYLWLLMRISPAADAFPEGVLGDLLDTARSIGFDTSNIRHVPHTI